MPRFAEFDASSLRRASGVDHFPWGGARVTLIRVDVHGVVTQASRITEKRQLLEEVGKSDIVLAAWPGEWRQDVFWVDDLDAARRSL